MWLTVLSMTVRVESLEINLSLLCPRRSRERILIYGDTGSSKTTAWLNIARWSQRTHSPAHFYVADTDNAVLDMLDEGYSDLTNVTVSPIYSFDEYQDWSKHTRPLTQPDDWMVVDLLGEAWSAVQRYFTEQVFGSDTGNYFMQARKIWDANKTPDKDRHEFEGWTDWKVINKLYQDFINPLCLRNTCHIFATSKQEVLQSRSDTKDITDTYGKFGVRPQGQKHLGHSFRTILLAQHPKRDQWVLSTVKDRERTQLEGEKVSEFTLSYLRKVAGWTL